MSENTPLWDLLVGWIEVWDSVGNWEGTVPARRRIKTSKTAATGEHQCHPSAYNRPFLSQPPPKDAAPQLLNMK